MYNGGITSSLPQATLGQVRKFYYHSDNPQQSYTIENFKHKRRAYKKFTPLKSKSSFGDYFLPKISLEMLSTSVQKFFFRSETSVFKGDQKWASLMLPTDRRQSKSQLAVGAVGRPTIWSSSEPIVRKPAELWFGRPMRFYRPMAGASERRQRVGKFPWNFSDVRRGRCASEMCVRSFRTSVSFLSAVRHECPASFLLFFILSDVRQFLFGRPTESPIFFFFLVDFISLSSLHLILREANHSNLKRVR